MDRFDSFQSNAGEVPVMRKWLLLAFCASLLLHLMMAGIFATTKLERFEPGSERLVPRTFTMSRAVIDPKLLTEDAREMPPKKEPTPPRTIELPKDTGNFEQMMSEVRATPVAPDIAKPIVNEKPEAGSSTSQAFTKFQQNSRTEMEKNLDSYRDQVLKAPARAGGALDVAALSQRATANSDSTTGDPGAGSFSTLDSLLGESGGLKKGTKPILLPAGLLFDFDKSELLPKAQESLQKLGTLIKRNPNVTFSIEGHTDSFGDNEHNQALSLQRAEQVKAWLLANMGIDASKIQTRGFGSSNLIVKPDPDVTSRDVPDFEKEVQRQQLNRRVEVVMHWNE